MFELILKYSFIAYLSYFSFIKQPKNIHSQRTWKYTSLFTMLKPFKQLALVIIMDLCLSLCCVFFQVYLLYKYTFIQIKATVYTGSLR